MCKPKQKAPSTTTTPKPKPKIEINAHEFVIRNEHDDFPALFNVKADGDDKVYNEGTFFPHLTVWPIVGAVVATLLLIFIVNRIHNCIQKAKAKKKAKKVDAEKARDSRLEAMALAQMSKFDEITEKIDQSQKIVEVHPKVQWDNDRFQEITERLDKIAEQPEKPGFAARGFAVAQPPVVPIADLMAQMPPVQFVDQPGQLAQMRGLARSQSNLPAVTFLDNGRTRRNRGRRH